MIGRFVAASGGRGSSSASLGEAVAEGAASGVEAIGEGATGPGAHACGATTAGAGSLRIELGTSGRGASSATSASIFRRLSPLALASTLSWFDSVRTGLSMRTAVRETAPEASASRTLGKRRQVRAAAMRLQAASSEKPRAYVQ